EILTEIGRKLKQRNKLIRIADSSEAGWDTVRQYEANPVASDSDDESRIRKAEARAVRQKKSKKQSQHKSPYFNAEPPIQERHVRGRHSQDVVSEPVSPVGSSLTIAETAPIPPGSHPPPLLERSETASRAGAGGKQRTMDSIEDEYYVVDSDERFTHNYFEYEQGQKDIIVKGRLKDNVLFWQDIGANSFVLDIIMNGYKIPFYSDPPAQFIKNNKSALKEHEFVSGAISDLLHRGLIAECKTTPRVVNPLSVSVQSNGKKRLILDLREVNIHLWKQSVRYEDLRLVLMYLEQGFWMVKFDIHSAYHFIDIFLPHTEYLGFAWEDTRGRLIMYKFLVLPFGISTVPYVYTKVVRPLVAKWRGEGKRMLMFLDDGFGCDRDFRSTQLMSNEIKQDLLKSGFVPNVQKSLWIPTQVLEFLGSILDSERGLICIPERRIVKAKTTLEGIR
ncbi:PREDICTED: uncharacterized protein LOC106820250, partial [Priapulus caudatus]|uniref:Uncharacterized protein LOC106820250 n=1 Tax=Priapulus caudatus TaxID=37621 RepID=A0ABM1F749_PRICU